MKEITSERSIEIQELVYNNHAYDTNGNTVHFWHASHQNI